MFNYKENITVKFAKQNYIANIVKLLILINPNKVVPIDSELYDLEDKINNSKTEFIDSDDCSTVGLSSNPSSFSSDESAEEYFSEKTYSFNPENFNMISILGHGSFGTVCLAHYKTNKYYAIKRLLKKRINEENISQIISEKNILMKMDNPFILRLYGTCQTKDELFFITEVLDNGDLFNAIYEGDGLTHEACVFYSSCIILGLDFIHKKNIVYRDLKPENVMIGSNGYPKIIDFGLAKQLPYVNFENGIERTYSKCYTLCGTVEYSAPEIIVRNGYDNAVDIWAFGVLLYEMIFKTTPFIDKHPDSDDYIAKIFSNIVLCGQNGIVISTKMDKKTDDSPNARNLISQLLDGNKKNRFGKYTTPADLLKHPYFLSTSVNAEDLYKQIVPAPIIQPKYIGKEVETFTIEEYHGAQDIFKNF
jgi:serine/threonine protein kinase